MAAHSPPTRWLARERGIVVAAAILAAAVFALSWYRHATIRSTTYDLGVFEQALWKMAHLKTPIVTTIGWNIFADHLSPVLVVFAPLFRVAATPLWLFAAQAIAAGVGLLAMPAFVDACAVRDPWLRRALLFAYAASPLLWNATAYDFHPTTLAPPVIIVGVTAALRDRPRVLAAMCGALVLLRDDLGAAVAALALVGVFALPRRRRPARFALAGAGLAWAAFGSVLGKAMGADRNWHFHYGYLGRSATRALVHPWRTIPRLVEGLAHTDNHLLVLAFLVPLACLPLLRPARFATVLALALPLFASAGIQFHSPHFHYGAPLLGFVLLGAATAVPRLPGALASGPAALAIAVGTIAGFVGWGPPATHTLTKPVARAADVRRARTLIRPTDHVVAGTNLGAQLAFRDELLPFPAPFTMGRRDFPLAAGVRHVSADRVARVDVVIVDVHEIRKTRRAYGHFLATPYLADFDRIDVGDLIVWRRRRG